ncbi:tetratricopeptide repeat protein [Paenibacillus sp. alder61]|uniref:Tetratricopeptide repeat protein n=1 Tax=Paenibacillus faecis TaxID=862114 RepID=A0A5D0D2N3_9BACL|nr:MULTISPECIES: tetratricopeptide repeat protein [Paenibacillus]MCA1293856.1 tetratricopeptide repeat protein [Paenibacillus sp. alder61]TYA15437.1 tetratricopeptide repeat protein [Paenibacillus faecis]
MKMKWHWAIVYLVGFFFLLVFFPSNHKPHSRIEEDGSIVQGDSLVRVGDFEQAVEVYAEVLRKDPENLEARDKKEQAEKIMALTAELIREGNAAARKNHLDEALGLFESAKELAPHTPNESYQKLMGVLEARQIKEFYGNMLELDAKWEQVKEELKKGGTLSSKKISESIAAMHPLAQKYYTGNKRLPNKPATPEGIRLYEEYQEMEEHYHTEFIIYRIIPEIDVETFEEDVDKYVENVKMNIQVFGLDYQPEQGKLNYKELFYIRHPELKGYQ